MTNTRHFLVLPEHKEMQKITCVTDWQTFCLQLANHSWLNPFLLEAKENRATLISASMLAVQSSSRNLLFTLPFSLSSHQKY